MISTSFDAVSPDGVSRSQFATNVCFWKKVDYNLYFSNSKLQSLFLL